MQAFGKHLKSLTLTIGSCIISGVDRRNIHASKRVDEIGNVRGVMLRDGVYRVPVAIHARLRYGVDNRVELDGVSFAAATNIHGNFDLHFNGRDRIAGLRDR